MFGIDDAGIYLAYLAAIGCLVFSAWFGITQWNKDDKDDMNPKKDSHE
ncbi:MAG: hypothetical protein LBV43_04955 [Prevotella sp.]|jgi:hypothetical protein|nr:hypothetical protein [Prevotella sp.]